MPSKPDYRRKIGQRIRAYRHEAGLTIEKLAERADLHHNFIGELERGKYDLSVGALIKIARALRIRARDLLVDI